MKKFILTIILLFSVFPFLNAQWEILNEGSKGNFNTIDFVNDNVGWIAGDNGTLLKTTDGGENWSPIAIDENWSIKQIDFINDSIGWAIGNDDDGFFIIKSTNGGISWITQRRNGPNLLSIYIIDENNAYVGSKWGNILKTTNGGREWSISQFNSKYDFNTIWALNPEIIVLGGKSRIGEQQAIILRTEDGGNSWQEIIIPEFANITNLQFLNDSTCYFLAGDKDWRNLLCKSVDACKSWTVVSEDVSSYCFINDTIVYSIMDRSIMKSTDGGFNWQNNQSFNVELDKIYFNQSGKGFLLGNLGAISKPILYTSYDSGNNWYIQKFTCPFKEVYFVDKDRGYLIGGFRGGRGSHIPPTGYLFSTSNGGKAWNDKYRTDRILESCVFVSEFLGFAITNNSIYKTADSGNNWIQVYEDNDDSTGFTFGGNDIFFKNEEIGWAVGTYNDNENIDRAGILGTTNGGENWDLINRFPYLDYFNCLFSICFAESTGWSVGEGGGIVKYTPQDGWELRPSVTDLPLNRVYFVNENYGWITGGYLNNNGFEHILLRTTDAGENWKIDQDLPYLINDIYFVDSSIGWAVGCDIYYKGVILESTDGGENWKVEVDNLIGPLNSIFIKDNYAWAVGEYGLVLRTTDAGTVWVEDESNRTYSTEFGLEQNYPNPFNPKTIIRYRLSARNIVTLKIYDLLGNEVSTIVNEVKDAGSYEVIFNASIYSSGIYYYKLQAGNFAETKKMILLK